MSCAEVVQSGLLISSQFADVKSSFLEISIISLLFLFYHTAHTYHTAIGEVRDAAIGPSNMGCAGPALLLGQSNSPCQHSR